MKKGYTIFLVFIIIAVSAPLISNQKPIFLIRDNKISLPFLSCINYEKVSNDFVIMPPIPYSPGVSDFDNADYKSPFSQQHLKNNSIHYRHWLGTTLRGCDVFAGIIHGTRYALLIGFFAALISLVIGVSIGATSAFSNEGRIHLSFFQLMICIIAFLFFYNLIANVELNSVYKWFVVIVASISFYFLLQLKYFRIYNFSINFEKIEMQLTILFSAVPRLFFVVAIMGIFEHSIAILIVLLGITGWMEIARMMRSELMRIQGMDYYASAQLSGASRMRITIKHILPNILPLIISIFSFSFGGAVLSEASLSFLGWGVAPDQVTWGTLIMEGKDSMYAWWLVVFPGACLSICLYTLFSIGRRWNNETYSL